MGYFRADTLKAEIPAIGLGNFRGIDAQMDKGGSRVRDGSNVKTNRSPVRGNDFTDRITDFADTDCIHPALHEDSKGSILGFVGEVRSGGAVDQMIHAR